MKKLKQIITVIAMAIFMLGAISIKAQKNNPLDYVGKSHNKNLDKIYSLLKKKNISSKEEAVKEIIEISKKLITSKDREVLDFQKNGFNFYPIQTYDFYFKLIENKKEISIPSDYKKYMFRMESIINSKDKKSLIKLVDEVNNNVKNKSTQEGILSAIAVAYNSMEYWNINKNQDKWKDFKFATKTEKKKKAWWKVGAVDAIAAVGTIAAGFFTAGIAWATVGFTTATSSAIAAVMIQ